MATSITPVITSMNTTPTENGSGAIGQNAASTSALALDSSEPVEWRRCHDSGRRWYWRVTRSRNTACSFSCMYVAPSRRATMPRALSRATPRIAAAAPTSAARVVCPVRNAGRITRSVMRPNTVADATVMPP